MKKLITIIAITTFIYSCGSTPTEQAIIDFEQTIDGIKTDLSMNIISSEKIGTLTFKDSATIYKEIFDSEVKDAIRKSEDSYFKRKRRVVEAMYSLASSRLPQSIKHYRESIDFYDNLAKMDSIYTLKLKNGDYSNSDLEKKYKLLRRYETFPDSLIAYKYITSYSIKNPLLNGVKQELKKEHWITFDNKIIFSERKKE